MFKKYNLKNLYKDTIKLYKRAQFSGFKNIHRGRNHCVSSKIEDLVALYIYKNLKHRQNYKVYTDKPISIKGVKSHTIYPDVLIVDKNNQIVSMFDVKTDMGYKRKELCDLCKNKSAQLDKLSKNKSYIQSFKNGKTELSVTKNTNYNIVIISSKNWIKGWEDYVKKSNKIKGISVYVLFSGAHPNSKKTEKNLILMNDDFDHMLASLQF